MATATAPTFKTLLYEIDDRVAIITINRPDKMNALSMELCAEMREAVKAADADDNVRVVVVTGTGGRAFSAGYDLGEEESEIHGIEDGTKRLNHDLDFTYSVWNCSKPTIAMIDGYCLAGGLEFAQMHDIRYASEDSRFAVIETRFSAGVATMAMPWIIGPLARELIYTGDMIDAETALRIGLVNRVFPKDQLRAEVMKIAHRMSRVAMAALKWNKRAINHTYETMGFRAALAYAVEACAIMDSVGTPEMKKFDEIRKEQGLQEALKWRKELFAEFE